MSNRELLDQLKALGVTIDKSRQEVIELEQIKRDLEEHREMLHDDGESSGTEDFLIPAIEEAIANKRKKLR